MHFLPDIYVPCEVCKGKRYNRETLEVKYKGKNIADVLNMTVEESLEFFDKIPKIKQKIQTLYDVGLRLYKTSDNHLQHYQEEKHKELNLLQNYLNELQEKHFIY